MPGVQNHDFDHRDFPFPEGREAEMMGIVCHLGVGFGCRGRLAQWQGNERLIYESRSSVPSKPDNPVFRTEPTAQTMGVERANPSIKSTLLTLRPAGIWLMTRSAADARVDAFSSFPLLCSCFDLRWPPKIALATEWQPWARGLLKNVSYGSAGRGGGGQNRVCEGTNGTGNPGDKHQGRAQTCRTFAASRVAPGGGPGNYGSQNETRLSEGCYQKNGWPA